MAKCSAPLPVTLPSSAPTVRHPGAHAAARRAQGNDANAHKPLCYPFFPSLTLPLCNVRGGEQGQTRKQKPPTLLEFQTLVQKYASQRSANYVKLRKNTRKSTLRASVFSRKICRLLPSHARDGCSSALKCHFPVIIHRYKIFWFGFASGLPLYLHSKPFPTLRRNLRWPNDQVQFNYNSRR